MLRHGLFTVDGLFGFNGLFLIGAPSWVVLGCLEMDIGGCSAVGQGYGLALTCDVQSDCCVMILPECDGAGEVDVPPYGPVPCEVLGYGTCQESGYCGAPVCPEIPTEPDLGQEWSLYLTCEAAGVFSGGGGCGDVDPEHPDWTCNDTVNVPFGCCN